MKEELRRPRRSTHAAEAERDALLARCRTPAPSAPDGDTEEDAVEIRASASRRRSRDPREHTEIGRFEMERAARVSGSRFGYLVGDTALLAFALYRFAIEHLVESRVHADAAAGPRARGGDGRNGVLPDGAVEHLRARGATTCT